MSARPPVAVAAKRWQGMWGPTASPVEEASLQAAWQVAWRERYKCGLGGGQMGCKRQAVTAKESLGISCESACRYQSDLGVCAIWRDGVLPTQNAHRCLSVKVGGTCVLLLRFPFALSFWRVVGRG